MSYHEGVMSGDVNIGTGITSGGRSKKPPILRSEPLAMEPVQACSGHIAPRMLRLPAKTLRRVGPLRLWSGRVSGDVPGTNAPDIGGLTGKRAATAG